MQLRKIFHRTNEGFSTIEAVVSMLVLSIIIVSAFVALRSLTYFSTWDRQTLQSSTLASTKMAQSFTYLDSNPHPAAGLLSSGTELLDGVSYEYTITTQPSTLSPNILIVVVDLSWDSQKPRTHELRSLKVLGGS